MIDRFGRSDGTLGENIRLCDQLVLVDFLFQRKQQVVGTIITQNLTIFTAVQKSVFLVEVIILFGKLLLYRLNLIFRFVICLYLEKFTHRITQIDKCGHAAVVL